MSNSKILTKEIAKQFLKDEDSVQLTEFTSIEVDAAGILSQHRGDLYLSALKTMSIAAAEALTQAEKPATEKLVYKSGSMRIVRRDAIHLDSLQLSPEVASSLAKYRGDQLVFHCTSIDLKTIQAFRPFKGQLWLGCVKHLDDGLAAELAARSGGAYLDGVAQYPNTPGYRELAHALCRWNRKSWLGLRGAMNIAPEVVEILAQFDGEQIQAPTVILKELRAARLSKIRRAGLEKTLALPVEWNEGCIFPNSGPAKSLKGRGAERVEAESASWWLPKKVCAWFVQKLHDTHKASVRGGDYGAGRTLKISPEAAGLLRDKAEVWLGLSEIESAATKAQINGKLESFASMEVPREFRNGRIFLPPPEEPLAKAYRWKSDFEGQDYQSVLHYYTYLPAEHTGSITDPNGYPAKAMSPEAAALYQRHQAFWEAKHAVYKAQAKAAGAERAEAAKKRFEKAASTAGITSKELDAKLDQLSKLVSEGSLTLVADMVAGFGEAWLYEALLAGASITPEGGLKPGRVLKRFKERAEIIMLLAIASMPEGVEVDPSIRTDAPVSLTVTAEDVDLVAESIAPLLPNLKPCMQGLEDLESLLPITATFLVRHEKVLCLQGLQKLGISEAQTLSNLQGDIYLDGLRQIDPDVAEALARVKGRLSLGGLSSVSEQEARELGFHVGDLRLNIKELPESIAASLARCKGDLELLSLNTITPSAAAELAKHCGKLTIGSSDFRLGADSAECLAHHSGPVVLGGVKSVTVEVGPEKKLTLVKVKEMLVNGSDGSVYVNGFDFEEFTHIDDDAADFLGAQEIDPPYLVLRGLVTISPSAAASLGALAGKCVVELGGISELTDKAAEAMAPFKNHFMSLPNTATKILAKARKRLKDKRR